MKKSFSRLKFFFISKLSSWFLFAWFLNQNLRAFPDISTASHFERKSSPSKKNGEICGINFLVKARKFRKGKGNSILRQVEFSRFLVLSTETFKTILFLCLIIEMIMKLNSRNPTFFNFWTRKKRLAISDSAWKWIRLVVRKIKEIEVVMHDLTC